ncbi:MAG TPA: prolyl oligopeptidase family serine peptidase, partial [Pyrinomonadaceae bacterium]|nr:prolyl oligopeptidase family serine peptidase [Pyrinomonadaceae bacterium]
PSLAGMRVEGEKLSPDGRKVVFLWNAEGKEPKDLYLWNGTGDAVKILSPKDLLNPNQPTPPESKLNYGVTVRDDFTKARDNQLSGFEFSPDSKRLLFVQNGDLYLMNVGTNEKPKRLTKTQSPEFFARWLDDKRIIFLQNGNIFTVDTEQFSLIQLSKEANPTAFISVGNVTTSKDGKMVAYVVSDTSKQRGLFVPNYLDEFTTAPTFRRGWSEQKILVTPTDGSRDNPFEIKLPKAEGVGNFRAVRWAADNQSLIIDRNDKDTKRRQLFYVHNVGSKAEKIILVTEETDEKWIAPLSGLVEANPKDNSQILFASEKDGSNHLYLATLERAKPQSNPTGEVRQENPTDAGFTNNVKIEQLTKGKFEIEWAKWTGGEKFIFSSTEKTPAEREFYEFDLQQKKYTQIDSGDKGMKISPQISENRDSRPILLYSFSQWNQPTELQTLDVCVGCRGLNFPQKITKTTPNSFKKTAWVEPKFVDIPSRDGKPIKSKIYLPSGFAKTKQYPMVIFVHGAGYLQNTINGWNNYYREYMFNHILTQKGYVVLDIDYRGSAGYGRDWRTDVYDFLGGKDYEDHLDAIDYMVKNYAVDAKKIGAYGGSYGGFMAEMLAFRTDKITCAAALRPVADWKNYYASSPVYTAQRLGFPDKNPEGYKRSSPISYAEGLNKPLLILHGMVDDNVHVQDSMQLIEKLMRLEKTQYFEAMLYPAENHGFTRPSSWTDEYERILSFFEKHLK